MRFLSQLSSDYLQSKTCLLRINLDIQDPKRESSRIDAAIPTIKYLIDNGSKVIILSHRGRPQGKDPALSLEPLIQLLRERTSREVDWLENLRFDPREQQNDDEFAKELAGKGDFYVNDDFAVSHRAHASVSAITKYLPSFAGLQLEKEISALSKVRDNPKKPLVVIIGGIKIDDKVGIINNLQDKAANFLMGSAYGENQKSKIKSQNLGKVIFTDDFSDEKKLDIGPKTVKRFISIINLAKTIIWNGPLGKVEDKEYQKGSVAIARAIADSSAFSVIGGGDTDQFINSLGLRGKFDFVSTGGGAMLCFLAGEKLPAIEALKKASL